MITRVDKTSPVPIYVQISDQIRRAILAGELTEGYLLPSERKLAAELDVHRNTVTRSYMELKSEGLIDARQGQGYRVQYRSQSGKEKKKAVNWEALIEDKYVDIRSAFDELYHMSYEEGLIPFGGGVAAREPYPAEEIADCFERILKGEAGKPYFHTPYQGDLPLRRAVADYLETRGIRVRPANLQVFSESNQTMDFLNSLLLTPGDTVLAPEAMSADVYRSIQLLGGKIRTVPMDEEGMVCDHLEGMMESVRPKYIYVDSSFNNPTGMTLSVARRQKLLDLSYRYRVPILEEDEGSELYYTDHPRPSIRSMDPGNNVLYLNSFSLLFRPGLGISFVAAESGIIERLRNMVSVRLAALDWAPQMITRDYMENGLFMKRLEDFRRICQKKRDRMGEHLDRFKKEFGIDFLTPEGGVYFWVKLPTGLDAGKLLSKAQKEGVTFIPGNLFYPDRSSGKDHIRLNFSYPSMEQIDEGMAMLERAFRSAI